MKTIVATYDNLALAEGALRSLAERVKCVWGYVNNHFAGHSPSSVRDLQKMIGQKPVMPDELGEQMTLF